MMSVRCSSRPPGVPRRQPWRQCLLAAAVAGMFVLPRVAMAGLGPVELLSAPGEPLEAVIPFTDAAPTGEVSVALAEHNRYPMLSASSASAAALHFSLQRSADGRALGVRVSGPAVSEPELDFAVAVRWADGGMVREYQLDVRHPRRPPAHDSGKRPAAAVAAHGGVDKIALGKLSVSSAPGAPLVAELPWLGEDRIDATRVRVRVSANAEGRPAPEVLAILSSMKYALVSGAGDAHVLRLFSDLPLDVPQLDFRLDVSLGAARAARRYRLTVAGATVRVAEHSMLSAHAGFRVLRVLPGDTLSQIARRLRHEGLSPARAMERLYRENPRAFIDGDIDRLLAGVLLRYPQEWASSADQAAGEAGRAAALAAELRQQERLLSNAQVVSRTLERRLADLSSRGAASSPHRPSVPRLPDLPQPSTREWALGGGLAVAAAATALMLGRRRRKAAAGATAVGTPTSEGLRQWLRYDPARDDLRFRLLLLLASQNDRAGFIEQALEANRRFPADSELWPAVLEMGRDLAPELDWDGLRPAPAPDRQVSAASAAMPERPIMMHGELDLLADDPQVFKPMADEAEAVPAMPGPAQTQALAELFMEMGYGQEAQNLKRQSGN